MVTEVTLEREDFKGYPMVWSLALCPDDAKQDPVGLEITRCESIETTLRTTILLWAGTLIRMSGGRLPKRIVFGNLEGAVRRGRGGKEK